ncbi:MAG: hypothetical protein NTV72_01035 [Candidatus Taylorbacteria bacterium]|nr:hypothetical protein [Candidatus Taylorbacteria bacterium]
MKNLIKSWEKAIFLVLSLFTGIYAYLFAFEWQITPDSFSGNLIPFIYKMFYSVLLFPYFLYYEITGVQINLFFALILIVIILFLVYTLIAILRKKVFADRFIFIDWILPIIILISTLLLIITPKVTDNSVDICLSGQLAINDVSSKPMDFSSDIKNLPEDCFKKIKDKKTSVDGLNHEQMKSWCNSLSDSKKVYGSNIPFANYVTYKDYCLYTINEKTLEENAIFKKILPKNTEANTVASATSSWQKYYDTDKTKNRFEFMAPAGLVASPLGHGPGDIYTAGDQSYQIGFSCGYGNGDVKREELERIPDISFVDGYPATFAVRPNNTPVFGYGYGFEENIFYTPQNLCYFIMDFKGDFDKQKAYDLVNGILQSIVFNKKSSYVETYKTYSNAVNGIEFNYSDIYFIIKDSPSNVSVGMVKYMNTMNSAQGTLINYATSTSLDTFLGSLENEVDGTLLVTKYTVVKKLSDTPVLLYKLYHSESNQTPFGGVAVNGNSFIFVHQGTGPSVDEILPTIKFTK